MSRRSPSQTERGKGGPAAGAEAGAGAGRGFAGSLGMRLRGAYLTFHRQAGAQLAPAGLTADQFVVLSILADEPALTQRDIVDRARSDPNTIGAILRRMEARRLVRRDADPDDARAKRVSLTPAGRKLQAESYDATESFRAALDGLFTAEERRTFAALLARIPPRFGGGSGDAGRGTPPADAAPRVRRRRAER